MITKVTFRDHEYFLYDHEQFELLRSRLHSLDLCEATDLLAQIFDLPREQLDKIVWYVPTRITRGSPPVETYPGQIIQLNEP